MPLTVNAPSRSGQSASTKHNIPRTGTAAKRHRCIIPAEGMESHGPGDCSDCLRQLGERRGDSKLTRGFGGDFVVAAAEVLDEGESGDDDLSGLFCA
jgi:hypothetical protein